MFDVYQMPRMVRKRQCWTAFQACLGRAGHHDLETKHSGHVDRAQSPLLCARFAMQCCRADGARVMGRDWLQLAGRLICGASAMSANISGSPSDLQVKRVAASDTAPRFLRTPCSIKLTPGMSNLGSAHWTGTRCRCPVWVIAPRVGNSAPCR
jgi:hypothetical protein